MIITINDLIKKALDEISSFELKDTSIHCYYSSYFKPILNQYLKEDVLFFNQEIMEDLQVLYDKQYEESLISKSTRNKRIRGLNILKEIYSTGSFRWKVFTRNIPVVLPSIFSMTILTHLNTRKVCEKNIHFEKNILERFVIFLMKLKIDEPSKISIESVRDFIQSIAIVYPKSMDKVVTAISKYLKFLYHQAFVQTDLTTIIILPRKRDYHIHAAMKLDDLSILIKSINKDTVVGKRDFAIISLVSTTGLRAGDIASLKLSDIDWKKQELMFVQGKTEQPLRLPLQKSVCNALADYILNSRPTTETNILFIRFLAPYVGFKDGVSIACILRKYLKKSGIEHIPNDGNTFHGIRRMLGTQMVISAIPVTTVSQVLGHQSIRPTKQYISLDIEGLRKCVLSMSSLGESL